jgi:hypothetical protein
MDSLRDTANVLAPHRKMFHDHPVSPRPDFDMHFDMHTAIWRQHPGMHHEMKGRIISYAVVSQCGIFVEQQLVIEDEALLIWDNADFIEKLKPSGCIRYLLSQPQES